MIYTCFDMLRDCRAGKPEGWSYFVTHYVPVIRRLLAHYFPERAGDGGRAGKVVTALCRPESSLFQSLEAAPERVFVAELRQQVLAAVEKDSAGPAPALPLDLETLLAAIAPLTVVEKQAVWLETMGYNAADTGRLLRMDPRTVDRVLEKAATLLRGSLDSWSLDLLAANGPQLGRAAAAAGAAGCLPSKQFLDLVDGRATWEARTRVEHHSAQCLHCVDHWCRLLEAVDLLRGLAPLSPDEAAPFRALLGVEVKKPAGWKRMFGAR